MSSYFVNPTFPGSLPGGQDSFLGQIPLYPAGYDALRHFPASYGASSLQDKTYTSPCFYQQSNTVIACNRASYEYGASCFYSDKEISSASPSGSGKQRGPGDYLHFSPDQQYKSSGVQAKIVNDEGTDRKYTSPVYPWMQRMNSCAESDAGNMPSVLRIQCICGTFLLTPLPQLISLYSIWNSWETREANLHQIPNARVREGISF
ncbi:homeobox protein Hox-A6 isoform X2 [Caloenas nicobarica]|uniref:homeobox protein Hox-A6 isoform X2 n=1 Tax=Caloenas nicobarica TaxID=187106 RepID=UPI0032B72ADB